MGTLGDDLKAFLTAHALPGVNINVIGYVPLPLGLDVTLRIDQAIYDPDKVADAARTAIQNSYALEKAGLGRTLFRSQILHLLESVEGVENATATLLTSGWAAITPPPLINTSEAGSVRSVEPRKTQMIHYDADLSNITIRTEDFSL